MKKSFWIDFCSWTIVAETAAEAADRVSKLLDEGQLPSMCNIEETGREDITADEIN